MPDRQNRSFMRCNRICSFETVPKQHILAADFQALLSIIWSSLEFPCNSFCEQRFKKNTYIDRKIKSISFRIRKLIKLSDPKNGKRNLLNISINSSTMNFHSSNQQHIKDPSNQDLLIVEKPKISVKVASKYNL